MVQYKLIDEYDNGWKAIRGESNYYVQTPTENQIIFGSSTRAPKRRRARLYAALCVRLGKLPMLYDPEAVPVEVSTAGKAEIAAYLWAVHYDCYIPDGEF